MAKALRKRLAQVSSLVFAQAALLFGCAGRLDWWGAWAYLTVYVGMILLLATWLLPRDPGLIAERAEIRPGVKDWDWVVGRIGAVLFLGVLIVAGLDRRFGWSLPQARWLAVTALLIFALGYLLFAWAMLSNPFFSAVVRIQTDRGHRVASGGPYHSVRHPAYAGMVGFVLATPVLLDSWWAMIPSVALAILVVVRTILEDRTLTRELPGYAEYSSQVRYRLFPGFW